MTLEARGADRDGRRSRFASVWCILGDRRERARLWIDTVLHRNATQPRRLEDLRETMREDGRAPFKAAAAVAEIQRFLADPAVYRSPHAAWWGNGDGLAGAYIRHVLDAQALAFSGRPSESAGAMRRALDALGGSTESQATAAARHRALLRALGESFQRDQTLLAHRGFQMLLAPIDRQEADGTQPLLPYLERQRARRLLLQGRSAEATAAFERAVAVAGPVTADDFAAHAIEIADIAVRAEAAADPEATSLLASATRRLDTAEAGRPQFARHAIGLADIALRAAADLEATSLLASATRWLDAAAEGEPKRAGVFAYWQGRVALAQAIRAEKAEAGHDAATRAIDRLEEAVRSVARRADAEAAASWLPEARRQLALHALRLGDAQPLAEALRQERDRSTVTLASGQSFTLSWSGLTASFKQIGTPFGQELIQLAAANLVQKRIMPPARPRRLVIEISKSALSTDPEAKRLIGQEIEPVQLDEEGLAPDDRSSPSIGALRRLLWSHFGVSLPAILVHPVPSDEPLKRIVVLLDNTPVYDAEWAMEAEHFVQGGGAVPWPFANYRELLPAEAGIETERIDAVQYAAWHLGRAVLRSLPQLAGPEHSRELGLGDLPSAVTHPMLQLLLWDRTPMLEREALRVAAMHAAAGRLSATAAAEAFRRVPAVRSSLWGVEGTWEDCMLVPEHEAKLNQLLLSKTLAGTVPGPLFEAVNQSVRPRIALATKPARGISEPPQQRLVVRDAELRPWLRTLLWQHPDVPVVAASEIGLPG
jgi:hypothetical protein